MRVSITVLYCSFCAAAAWSQSGPDVGAEPSRMEAFTNRHNVHTTWSKEIARWENNGARLVVTALVLEEGDHTLGNVRGLKIDLSSGKAKDRIYLDEPAAERTRSALEEIADAVGPSRGSIRPARNGCVGAKEFWPLYDWPWNKYHELNADFCGDASNSALVLCGRGRDESFRFPGQNPTNLARILASAINLLREH